MSIEVRIPAIGESITSGIISSWHKKTGEYVEQGEMLLTLETDKISTELTADKAGKLEIQAEEGKEVKIGEVVATIDDTAAAPPKSESQPAAAADKAEVKTEAITSKGDSMHEDARDVVEQLSPAVRRILEEEKISPDQVKGTGKGGRITKEDVVNFIESRKSGAAAAQPSQPAEQTPQEKPQAERFTRKPLSALRRKIASQLVMAQQTAAILTTFNECDMSAILELRKKHQEDFQKKNGIKLGFMSFFIKAAVEALTSVPAVNGRMDGDDFIQNHYYDIGVAVGTERGLIVPVIRDADQKSFAEIETDIISYANKAREGKISYADLQGGVFTISNGGVYGSLLSTPIINPPQSGILGMHKTQERPVAVNGQVVIRPMMYLALSYDHRVVDGKEAVTFLVRVKDCLEDPARLLLGA